MAWRPGPDGTLWTWGYGYSGVLGDGTTEMRTSPAVVTNLTGVVKVAAGYWNTYAIRNNGTLWSAGSNDYGQLGNGTFTSTATFIPITAFTTIAEVSGGREHVLALDSSGTVWAWGNSSNGQLGNGSTDPSAVPVTVLTGAVAISAGQYHSLALRADGIVGRLTITQQLLTTAQAPGQTLVICSAPRHSPSAEALSLLARTVRE